MNDAVELEDPAAFAPEVWELAGGPEGRQRLERYARLLVAEGELRGLIGPRELGKLWSRHIINSLVAAPLVPQGSAIADVGSGAGFPGIVWAATRPDMSVTLIETMERRSQWLTEVIAELGLTNARVVNARSEDVRGELFDVVTARAVARLPKLIPWTLPLVRPGGTLLALKGEQAAAEIEEARPLFRKWRVIDAKLHSLVSPLDGELTRVVELITAS